MVTLDRALVSSVTMSLAAAVWPQFAMQVFRGSIGRLTCIGSYVNKQVTTFTFRAQATTCSKHYTRTVMDAGCECAPRVRSANPSDSWALVNWPTTTHKRKIFRKIYSQKLENTPYTNTRRLLLPLLPLLAICVSSQFLWRSNSGLGQVCRKKLSRIVGLKQMPSCRPTNEPIASIH